MQKIMRRNDGVTLTVLIITIIVLIAVIAVTITYGISTLQEIGDDRTETEIALVQQAIAQQYTLLLTQNEDDKPADSISSDTEIEDDSDRPSTLVGTRIADTSELEEYGFSEYIINYDDYDTMVYEYYYYYLDEEDLEEIGIEMNATAEDDAKERKYIVNYSTGEVFDIANQTYTTSDESVYLDGTNSKINETTYNFTDE